MRLAILAVPLLAALLPAVACAEDEPVVTEDIVSSIPWPDEERAEYLLVDRDSGEEFGRGVLSATRRGDRFELSLRFEGRGDTDEAVVAVDAETLKPYSVRRHVTAEGKTTVGDYRPQDEIVEIVEIDDDGDKRAVPLRLPEHYYDNESSFFLWRTILFEEGYEASYHSILANQRSSQLATVKVVGREEIAVPAGTFQSWRVEIEAGGAHPIAWYADIPERPLVQFENEDLDLVIQLTTSSGG